MRIDFSHLMKEMSTCISVDWDGVGRCSTGVCVAFPRICSWKELFPETTREKKKEGMKLNVCIVHVQKERKKNGCRRN